MAKKPEKKEEKILADERVINSVSSFFSDNAMKIVFIFVVVLAVIVVYSISSYMTRSHNKEVADYLQETFTVSNPYGAGAEEEDEESLNVSEILEKTEDTRFRAWALLKLGKKLYRMGGEENLKKAEEVARKLRDEGVEKEQKVFQVQGTKLLDKIREEREYTLPDPEPFGPEPEAPDTEEAAQEKTTEPVESSETSAGGDASGEPEADDASGKTEADDAPGRPEADDAPGKEKAQEKGKDTEPENGS